MTFPDNQVIIIYYDETTPTSLYSALAAHQFTTTLHKWGYGIEPTAPKIEGAEYFKLVYAFPLPNDMKPICYDDTAKADTPQEIQVVNLHETLISKDKLLFSLPLELKEFYSQKNNADMLFFPVDKKTAVKTEEKAADSTLNHNAL